MPFQTTGIHYPIKVCTNYQINVKLFMSFQKFAFKAYLVVALSLCWGFSLPTIWKHKTTFRGIFSFDHLVRWDEHIKISRNLHVFNAYRIFFAHRLTHTEWTFLRKLCTGSWIGYMMEENCKQKGIQIRVLVHVVKLFHSVSFKLSWTWFRFKI